MIDYEKIKSYLMPYAEQYVSEWCPGKPLRNGDEYKPINPTRPDKTPGSFSINLRTGAWSDFATRDSGRDLISLYRYVYRLPKNSDAAIEIDKRYNFGCIK